MPLSVFSTSQKPIDSFSYPRWIVSKLVAAPLWWSMGKLGVVDTEAGMSEEKAWKVAKGDWVVIDALKVRPSPLVQGAFANARTGRRKRRMRSQSSCKHPRP